MQSAVNNALTARRGTVNPIAGDYRPGLDAIRFLAAIWVMLYHASAVKGGGHAVAIFFLLSGYLIGGQLIKEKRLRSTIPLNEFYFKRVTRIWPPYFLMIIGYILLLVARGQFFVPGSYEQAFGALTYTYNFVHETNLVHQTDERFHPCWISINHIWSLSIEEQFYLVVPLMIAWVPLRFLKSVCLIMTALLLYLLPIYAGLVAGVLLATLFERGTIPRPPVLSPKLVLVGTLVTGVALFLVGHSSIDCVSWLTYLLAAILVALSDRISLPSRWHGVLRYLGLMTYSYYLIHGFPGYFLGAAYRKTFEVEQNPVALDVFCGLLALPVSYLFVRFVELPCLARRNQALKAKSPWVGRAIWLAWGLSLIGFGGLIFRRHVFTRDAHGDPIEVDFAVE